jgi:hypothetical protein
LSVLSLDVLTLSVPKVPLTMGEGAKPDPGVADAGAVTIEDAISIAEAGMRRVMRFICSLHA